MAEQQPESDVVSLTWTLAPDDIRLLKEQQYSVTNYGLALLGRVGGDSVAVYCSWYVHRLSSQPKALVPYESDAKALG